MEGQTKLSNQTKYKISGSCLIYKDGSFKLVVWDPPHMVRKNPNGKYLMKVCGHLDADSWKDDLRKRFAECGRVLGPDGVLIFMGLSNFLLRQL